MLYLLNVITKNGILKERNMTRRYRKRHLIFTVLYILMTVVLFYNLIEKPALGGYNVIIPLLSFLGWPVAAWESFR
jgi:hypothetical protein